jgi:excinuclease ABC subunit C
VQRGDKRRLIELAESNAARTLSERIAHHVGDDTVLEEVRRQLHLRRLPHRVEAFDISNIQGTDPVASLVVWEDNQPLKSEYRKFKVRSVTGPDDFQAMFEVITRRFRRSGSGEQPLPDLILIDGGKGQVNVAQLALEQLGVSPTQVDLIGLAKGRSERRRGQRRPGGEDYEYVVKPLMKGEQRLKRNSTTLHFLQRIRDESHRFAITFHRSLRKRRALSTELEALQGVGPKHARTLLRHFGSLKRVQAAELDALQRVPGLPLKTAERIWAAYHGAGAAPAGAPLAPAEALPGPWADASGTAGSA